MIGTGEPYKPQTAGTYKLAWSGDKALRQPEVPPTPPKNADNATRKVYTAALEALAQEFDNLRRVARETQDWSALLVEDGKPTWFVMRWLPYDTFERWNDSRHDGKIGDGEAFLQLFRLALVDVEGVDWPGWTFSKPVYDAVYRDRMAPVAVLDDFRRLIGKHAADHLIAALGSQVYLQETATRPL